MGEVKYEITFPKIYIIIIRSCGFPRSFWCCFSSGHISRRRSMQQTVVRTVGMGFSMVLTGETTSPWICFISFPQKNHISIRNDTSIMIHICSLQFTVMLPWTDLMYALPWLSLSLSLPAIPRICLLQEVRLRCIEEVQKLANEAGSMYTLPPEGKLKDGMLGPLFG